MPKRKIAVLGGGASGLMAAISAAKNGADVTIIEHKDRVGKKILMTGNGKCNLTNLHIDRTCYYSHDLDKAMQILAQFTPEDTISFWKELGLMTKEKRDGGIYPVAEQAAVVLDVLRAACDAFHITTVLGCTIETIDSTKEIKLSGIQEIPIEEESDQSKKKKGKTQKQYIRKKFSGIFDALIIACGGCAAPVSGSDGSGYRIVRGLGCHVYEPLPALVQLYGKGSYFKAVAGVRVEAAITLLLDHKRTASEYGELQLTDYGISGIPVFQISRLVSEALAQKKRCEVEIDFYPYDQEALPWERFPKQEIMLFLEGYLPKKIAALLLKESGIAATLCVEKVSQQDRDGIFRQMHHFRVPIEKTNSFESAQVCAGGVSLKDIHMDMSMVKNPAIYIVGELLDVDGKCGGYNLQWAWSTGYLAGVAAAGLEEDK